MRVVEPEWSLNPQVVHWQAVERGVAEAIQPVLNLKP